MRTAAIKIADFILFELETVNDPGPLRLGFFLFLGLGALTPLFGGFQFFRAWITKNQDEAAAVRGPRKVLDILGSVAEAFGFTAMARQEPDLLLALVASG